MVSRVGVLAVLFTALAGSAVCRTVSPPKETWVNLGTPSNVFGAILSGKQQTDRETTVGDPGASGFVQLNVHKAPAKGQILVSFSVTVNQLTGTESGVHIRQGAAGQYGDFRLGLTGTWAPLAGVPNTMVLTGTVTDTAQTKFLSALIANPGGFYLEVETLAYDEGAVSGQFFALSAIQPPTKYKK